MKVGNKIFICCLSALLFGCAATYESAEESYQDGDVQDAKAQWTELATQGDARSMYRLYDIAYLKTSSDWNWLEKSAQLNYPQAKFEWGLHQIANEEYMAGIETIQQAKDLGVNNADKWLESHQSQIKWWPQAEQGDTGAMVDLGRFYLDDKKYNKAQAWFRKASEKKSAIADFYIGVIYGFGYGLDKNQEIAYKWYKKAADKGNSSALFNMCVLTRDGEGVAKDLVKARDLCLRSAVLGHSNAEIEYGIMLLKGIGGKKNPKHAKTLLERYVGKDYLATSYVGDIYYNGYGVEIDYVKAREMYSNAYNLSQNKSYPAYKLATIYEKGLGTKEDRKQAFFWFKRAAELGDSYSQRRTAFFYDDGKYVDKNRQLAVQWLEKSAKGGDTIAQYYIGMAYLEGDGVSIQFSKAEKYLKQAAEAGDRDAQFQIGYEYSTGEHFKKNDDQFFYWTQKSANQDHEVAQYNLSVAYANGRGVKKNYAWSAYWRAKSAAHNYSSALENMSGLLDKLNKYYVLNSSYIYEETDTKSKKVNKIAKGDLLYRLGTYQGWLEVVSSKGYHLGYVQNNDVTDKALRTYSSSSASSSSPFPARPAKVAGRVSCNTRCINSTCWRTFDDGRQVKFQAQRKYNAFSGEFEWDSGSCTN